MSLAELLPWAKSLWTVWFSAVFLGIVIWTVWPTRRRRLEEHGCIPLRDEPRAGVDRHGR
jgi:cytochrome c oxidase cbb3-type subunit 4